MPARRTRQDYNAPLHSDHPDATTGTVVRRVAKGDGVDGPRMRQSGP
jgi:hypothetical protein